MTKLIKIGSGRATSWVLCHTFESPGCYYLNDEWFLISILFLVKALGIFIWDIQTRSI